MGKTLVIVESPSKGRKIAKFLGDDYIVQASVGHVIDLTTTGKYSMGINIDNGFKPKYDVIPDKKDKIKAIIKHARQCDHILLATDPDREGEAIAKHLSNLLVKINPSIKRVEFHEITKECVLKNIKNPKDIDENLFQAQQARRVLDRIVGFSVSPYLIDRLGPKLSAGRVQSVAVKLIVDRERLIEAFIPEEYWNITSTLHKDGDTFTAKYIPKITNRETAEKVQSELKTDSYIIKNVLEKEQKKKPLTPLITSSLQSTAAGKYKLSSARTMKAAQKLYESGMVTYIRTDSTRLATSAVDFCRQWLEENGYDIPKNGNQYLSKKAAQNAHEAIRPTDANVTPQNIYLSEDEKKIYSLIWERFMASQMKPALYDSVVATVTTSSGHELKATGKTLKYKGWLEITSDGKKDDKNTILPILKKNDKLKLIAPKVKAEQKFTRPASRFTNKTLVDELEIKSIGRPSTYAAIISKITNKSYVIIQSNSFVPTDKGISVVDELTKYFNFMEYNYTADMEKKLDMIAAGEMKYVDMMTDFYTPFKEQLRKAYGAEKKDYGFRCDKCEDAIMHLRHGKFGYYLACINWPKNCSNTISCSVVDGKPSLKKNRGEKNENVRCPNCKSAMIKFDGNYGPYYGCSEWPVCSGKRKVPWGKKCPECRNELYSTWFHSKNVLFCMGYSTINCKYSEDLPEGSDVFHKDVVKKRIPHKIYHIIK